MARYAIGDIQGCYYELLELLELISFNPSHDEVYLVGDLVNRGPTSLPVLQLAYTMQSSIKIVLGNHDLHLLACWAGISKPKNLDTFYDVLHSPDCDNLMHWMREQPLMRSLDHYVIAHAGINPAWSESQAMSIADFCSTKLAGADYQYWLGHMYGNLPIAWCKDLSPVEQFRLGVNSFTRMRMVSEQGLDFKFKGELADAPAHLSAWFSRQTRCTKTIIFGHWSALGLVQNKEIAALDTGCIWGGQLTAISLDNHRIYQVPAHRSYQAVSE